LGVGTARQSLYDHQRAAFHPPTGTVSFTPASRPDLIDLRQPARRFGSRCGTNNREDPQRGRTAESALLPWAGIRNETGPRT